MLLQIGTFYDVVFFLVLDILMNIMFVLNRRGNNTVRPRCYTSPPGCFLKNNETQSYKDESHCFSYAL